MKDERGTSTVARGRAAERRAAEHYRERGAQILAMNYCVRGGEIDVIARQGGYVVFIEVKMRESDAFGAPAEAVTPAKQRRICRAALKFAQENGLLDSYMRFDVCEIMGDNINIYENAFDYSE